MMTIFYRAMNIGLMIALPLAFVIGCTTSGESGRSDAGPETSSITPGAQTAKTINPVAKTSPLKEPETIAESGETANGNTEEVTPATSVPAPSKIDNSIYLGSDGKMAGIGDPNKPSSEAYRIGMRARPAALAGAGLPKDKFGLVDWVAVVDQEKIKPLGSLDPNTPDAPPLDLDIVIKAKGDFVRNVLFPHKAHTYWLDCQSCHPAIFQMAKGQNKMSMVEISQGEWCGRCHGKVAFPLTDCSRCHNQNKVAPQ
ncbi:c(7)-type cytochrome triheme domain-containing protein [Thiolapillus sp.]